MNAGYYYALLLLGCLLASLIFGLLLGMIFKGFNGDFDHTHMVDRAREQRRRELRQ